MLEIQGTAACGWSYASRGCKKTWRRPEHSQHVGHRKVEAILGVS